MSSLDPTFSSYTKSQAQKYAQARLSYPSQLYDTIITHHTQTGGQLGTLADVGCGPGNATRDLALSFEYAVGLDPGTEMISLACQRGARTRTGGEVRFAVAPAENCAAVIAEMMVAGGRGEEKVDLLTAAMAAHWFDMPKFWANAAKIVKPGGTVALWTCASLYCHPSTPNAAAVQAALFRLEREVLSPYELPSNRLSRDLYDKLVLPWDKSGSNKEAFPVSGFVRMEWDRDGILSDGREFFGGESKTVTLTELASGLDTASMVTRWREAHSELVGTDKDCVHEAMNEVRAALGRSSGEGAGDVSIKVGSGTVLLLFKRK
ncbi:hypothetical protein PISL3812_04831 [Talaromyces islandicus]|uniref:Methyltransferase type 11 domain-containing protein n=1 Tax=Talaromyces islandicus TaxID=28573 RepID=A0A0U1LYS6_TALIS|nr:hypothetical protein PISL3812_04831 [Talaromyces islandicus]